MLRTYFSFEDFPMSFLSVDWMKAGWKNGRKCLPISYVLVWKCMLHAHDSKCSFETQRLEVFE